MPEDEVFYCSAETYRQTRETPAEYCEEEVDNEGDLCHYHDDDLEPEPDNFDDWRHGID